MCLNERAVCGPSCCSVSFTVGTRRHLPATFCLIERLDSPAAHINGRNPATVLDKKANIMSLIVFPVKI